MKFILQKEKASEDIEIFILKNMIGKYNHFHSYVEKTLEEIRDYFDPDAIPVGTIEFVTLWFRKNHGIQQMNPIEIPKCLRLPEFLKRDYSIVKAEDIPQNGKLFIKDVTELKRFSYDGDISAFLYNGIFDKPEPNDCSVKLDPEHLYQVSESVPILSEYRVYIINGKIDSIIHFDGNPLLFPDTNLLNKANSIWSFDKDYPKSASMDVMITPRGTAITECHAFVSVGLYSTLYGDNLMYAYRDGIDYVLNKNILLEPFSVKN